MIVAKAILAAVMGSRWIQYVLAAFIVTGGYAVWLHNYGETKKEAGKEELRAESKQLGKEAHAKSEEAHARAAKPGAAERLRKQACVDCD